MGDRQKLTFPDNDRFCVSRWSLLAICNRDETAAKIINLFNSCPPRYISNDRIRISLNQIIGLLQHTCSQNTVMKSLKWLHESGMITSTKEARSITSYVFNSKAIQLKLDAIKIQEEPEDLPENTPSPDLANLKIDEEIDDRYLKIDATPTSNLMKPTSNLTQGLPQNSCRSTSKLMQINIEDTEKDVFKDLAEDKTLTNTYSGSVCTTPLTAVATAPLTSVAYAPSLAIEKENFQESAIETTSAIITTSASHPGHEVGKMNTTDVLTQIFIKYAKVPEKKRDAKCKGSASRLMQNWGDRIKSVVDEVGEEALVAMDNFIRDEYWLAKGLPLPAFKSQFRKYLSSEEPESEEQSEIQTSAKPARKSQASSGSSYQPSQFAYTDHHPIAVFSLQDQSGAILRKREALDILQQVGGDLEAEGRAEIGFKIDPSMYSAIEEWHSKALQAYKSIKNRDYPVLTEPIKGVLNA